MAVALLDPIVDSLHSKSETNGPSLFVFGEPVRAEVVEAPAESTANYLLKIPVAPLGDWKHPIYKDVSFSQQDFDQMLSNWQGRAVGYEPPLFLGHPVDPAVMEGAPSIAFLCDLKQEGDTLYSYYEPVEPDLFEPAATGGLKVKGKGVYRYSSAEVVRNVQSKADGSDIGTVFIGMALTNRPFVPHLPLPEVVDRAVYSNPDSSTVRVVFESLNPSEPMTTDANTSTEAQGLPNLKELSALVLNQNSQITQLSDQLTAAATQLEAATRRIAQLEGDAVERTISALNMPAALRQTFSSVLTADGLSEERKSELLQQLQAYSDSQAAQLTTVQGDATQTTASAESTEEAPVNPYSQIIEKNQRLADERAKKQALV